MTKSIYDAANVQHLDDWINKQQEKSSLYQFTDLRQKARADPPVLPAEAMYLLLTDGKYHCIEELIPDYQTLNVTGRELLPRTVKSASVDGYDGAIPQSFNYPTRTIQVTYQLDADSNDAFRKDYQRLNELFQRSAKVLTFAFNDERIQGTDANGNTTSNLHYYYTGALTGASTPSAGSNHVVGNFTITCFDPFKHEMRGKFAHPDTNGQIDIGTYLDNTFPVSPKKIHVVLSAAASTIIIQNQTSGQEIRMDSDTQFAAGHVISIQPTIDNDEARVLDLPNTDANTTSGANIEGNLALDSDLENFTVKKGDVVQMSADGSASAIDKTNSYLDLHGKEL